MTLNVPSRQIEHRLETTKTRHLERERDIALFPSQKKYNRETRISPSSPPRGLFNSNNGFLSPPIPSLSTILSELGVRRFSPARMATD